MSSDSLSISISYVSKMGLPQAIGEVSWASAGTSGDLEFSIGESGEVSGTLALSLGMEGEVASSVCLSSVCLSSDCFMVGMGCVRKSQGRGTCQIQIVSKDNIQITRICKITKATGRILI
jgi:hypothetical protein